MGLFHRHGSHVGHVHDYPGYGPAHGHHPHDLVERLHVSRRVVWVSLACNLVLVVAQIVIGWYGHSQALIADGFHTAADLTTDLMVLFAVTQGARAADSEHPYGHARIETAVTLLLGLILVAVGGGIASRGGFRMLAGTTVPTPAIITLWAAGFTLLVKEGLYHYTMHTAKRFDSKMLAASAWHHRSDAISSFIVLLGILGSRMGHLWLDAATAIAIGVLIVKIGVELAWQALHELIDTGLDEAALSRIRTCIMETPGVRALHYLRTRQVGGETLADVHIIVDGAISVSEGHQIGEAVRARLMDGTEKMRDVMVHIDTEDDRSPTASASLPLRDEVETRLATAFRSIGAACQIEKITLHYREGQIDVEIVLPFSCAPDAEAVAQLRERFARAVGTLREIGVVRLYFA